MIVLEPKIVNHKFEIERSDCVLPEAGSDFCGDVSVGFEVLVEFFIRCFSGLRYTIHPFPSLHMHPLIVDLVPEVVCSHKFVCGGFYGDADVFIAIHGHVEIRIFHVHVHVPTGGVGDYLV